MQVSRFLGKDDLMVLVSAINQQLPGQCTDFCNEATADDLWRLLDQQLARHSYAAFGLSLRMISAESGTSLNQAFVSPHIQREGVKFSAYSLMQLPDETDVAWADFFFGIRRDCYDLFFTWMAYIRDPRS